MCRSNSSLKIFKEGSTKTAFFCDLVLLFCSKGSCRPGACFSCLCVCNLWFCWCGLAVRLSVHPSVYIGVCADRRQALWSPFCITDIRDHTCALSAFSRITSPLMPTGRRESSRQLPFQVYFIHAVSGKKRLIAHLYVNFC